MTLLPPVCTIALKEWAVAVDTMARGEQIMILRKGGIHRDDKEFQVLHQEFLLFPTYEHQKRELLKDGYDEALARTLEENDVPGLVTLSYWCTVTDMFQIGDEGALASLADHHMWSDDYAQKRLHWRPKQSLTVALLRLYRMVQPQALPVLDEYIGCKSWVDLGQEVPLGYLEPVLTDEQYEAKSRPIREALRGVGVAGVSGG